MEMRRRRSDRSAADAPPSSSRQPIAPSSVAPPHAPPADARGASSGDGEGGHGRGQGQKLGSLDVGSAYSQDGLSTDDQLDTRASTVGPWLLRNIPFNWLHLEAEEGGGRSGSDSKRKRAEREEHGGKEAEAGARAGAGARSQGGAHETSVVSSAVTHACSNLRKQSTASTSPSLPIVSPCSSPTLSIRGLGCLTDDEAWLEVASRGAPPRAPPREWQF